jgi:hypothetical protein
MKNFIRQFLIFSIYLIACSIIVFIKRDNPQGLFVLLLFICAVIHLSVILFKWSVTRKKGTYKTGWTGADLIAFVIITFIFCITFGYFIQFIRWVFPRQ